ncbi:MAG TPA: rRNA maturation RNase YbeY [Bacteroidales bacterium]|nr:rRNA maturation RNase YbeY [Bacteroidales bacterium]HOL99075.1 rRNA maturation RNase YbeY [Bacteroidales bacterium]HOM37462.1 rRNA maturation RNase YbeY [Bacteroidales bacterium]HPD24944.1 rRNA maturation RNase YbeY [Bacteroidales bacterium]HRT00668.1 rRNA maturation RNase YbeY [Bacteroidales bacterium]
MAIIFYSEDVKKPRLKFTQIKEWIRNTIKLYGKKEGNINYIFCSDEYIIDINKKYLEHDYFTDIITFDYCENDTTNGDIYISLERVEENAIMYGTQDDEIYRVIIHGILHLCGFEDNTPEEIEEMRRMEDEALKQLNNYLGN